MRRGPVAALVTAALAATGVGVYKVASSDATNSAKDTVNTVALSVSGVVLPDNLKAIWNKEPNMCSRYGRSPMAPLNVVALLQEAKFDAPGPDLMTAMLIVFHVRASCNVLDAKKKKVASSAQSAGESARASTHEGVGLFGLPEETVRKYGFNPDKVVDDHRTQVEILKRVFQDGGKDELLNLVRARNNGQGSETLAREVETFLKSVQEASKDSISEIRRPTPSDLPTSPTGSTSDSGQEIEVCTVLKNTTRNPEVLPPTSGTRDRETTVPTTPPTSSPSSTSQPGEMPRVTGGPTNVDPPAPTNQAPTPISPPEVITGNPGDISAAAAAEPRIRELQIDLT